MGLCVCVFVGLLPRYLEFACIDHHQTGSIIGKGSDRLQLIKFWPSRAPGKGSVVERKFCLHLTASADSLRLRGAATGRNFWLRLTTARSAVFASL